MQHFVTENAGLLDTIRLVTWSIAFLFGASALGRFPVLSKPGGFYSALLVAITIGVLAAGITYGFNFLSGNISIRLVDIGLRVSVDAQEYAIFSGIIFGFLPALTFPETYRRRFVFMWLFGRVKRAPETSTGSQSTIVTWLGVVFGLILVYMYYSLSLAVSSVWLFGINGWFGGQIPPLSTLLSISALLTVITGGYQFLRGVSLASRQYLANIDLDTLDENLDKIPDDVSNYLAVMMANYRILRLFTAILGVLVVAYSLVLIVVSVGFVVYLWRTVGPVALAFLFVGLVSYILFIVVREIGDKLGTKVLVGIFVGVPTVIASALQFALLHIALLPK